MKIYTGLLIAIISITCVHAFAEGIVAIGDNEIDVRNKMGKPSGIITIGKNEKILSYSNGDIILKDGKVSKTEFLPAGKTYSDINKNSADKLQQRITFDKDLFNQPLNKFNETSEFKDLSDPDKITKLKEFKEANPNVDIADQVKTLEKKIAEYQKNNPSAPKPTEKPVVDTPPVATQPSVPKYQGSEPNYYPKSISGYPTGAGSGASSGGYNFQQNDFYKTAPKTNEPAKPIQ